MRSEVLAHRLDQLRLVRSSKGVYHRSMCKDSSSSSSWPARMLESVSQLEVEPSLVLLYDGDPLRTEMIGLSRRIRAPLDLNRGGLLRSRNGAAAQLDAIIRR